MVGTNILDLVSHTDVHELIYTELTMNKKKADKKKIKEKLKRDKHGMRLSVPPHKVHKSKKDFKRIKKVKLQDVETE